jgi:hypothetical protein
MRTGVRGQLHDMVATPPVAPTTSTRCLTLYLGSVGPPTSRQMYQALRRLFPKTR